MREVPCVRAPLAVRPLPPKLSGGPTFLRVEIPFPVAFGASMVASLTTLPIGLPTTYANTTSVTPADNNASDTVKSTATYTNAGNSVPVAEV